jgi:hypothetical protein
LVALCILVPFIETKLAKHPLGNALIAYPLAAGAIRLAFCLWNLSTIF